MPALGEHFDPNRPLQRRITDRETVRNAERIRFDGNCVARGIDQPYLKDVRLVLTQGDRSDEHAVVER